MSLFAIKQEEMQQRVESGTEPAPIHLIRIKASAATCLTVLVPH